MNRTTSYRRKIGNIERPYDMYNRTIHYPSVSIIKTKKLFTVELKAAFLATYCSNLMRSPTCIYGDYRALVNFDRIAIAYRNERSFNFVLTRVCSQYVRTPVIMQILINVGLIFMFVVFVMFHRVAYIFRNQEEIAVLAST